MTTNKTKIEVSAETADGLHSLKDRGDSYDDVIVRLMDSRGE